MTNNGDTDLRLARRNLFLISFLILFLELACIRWLASAVIFLTFFTNVVLMATFLGMSVGCMTAARRRDFGRWVLPVLCVTIALALLTLWLYQASSVAVGVGGNASGNPQLIYFGTEARHRDVAQFVVPIEVIAGVFFTLVALVFVGLGQVMGRAFDAIPSRVGAYTIDVLGSLTGIAAFFAISWWQIGPFVWFLVAISLCLYFARPWTPPQVVASIATLFLVGITSYGGHVTPARSWPQVFWSPYYRVDYDARWGTIDTNNIGHQGMISVRNGGPAYMLPHLLNRDAGGRPFKDVMIIGAGSGNDVSAALQMGGPDTRIDAVEIDPVIAQIGVNDHPEQWSRDKRVTVHKDDGRRFVRKTQRQYDLISYALVDSLVLQSGYSSLRLESFLFTREAFADINAKLKPGGVFAMYNFYRQGWVVARLAKMAEDVFGVKPLIVSLPYVAEIKPTDPQASRITFLLVGKPIDRQAHSVPALDAIRAKFAASENFWVHGQPSVGMASNGFNPIPPGTTQDDGAYFRKYPNAARPWRLIAPADVQTEGASIILPTDDWPFLYLRDRAIPGRPGISGMAMIGGLSIAILLAFTWPVWFGRGGGEVESSDVVTAPPARARFNVHMFFLGAGFMLLETKGVVHMALLFGSTWVVNSVVFFAILVMILIANLFVLALRPRNPWPWYGLLGAALLIGALVPMSTFLSMSPWLRVTLSCGVFFAPVFFAGVIFATSFRNSLHPDIDFGSHVAGIILGGMCEQLSLLIGFNKLLLVAIGLYFLSSVFKPRRREPDTIDPPIATAPPPDSGNAPSESAMTATEIE
jgi:spermidine synthase